MIGIAEISADVRFTFGSSTLLGGIEIVSALIGLYCLPVLIDLVATSDKHLDVKQTIKGYRLIEALVISSKNKLSLLRSSLIGTFVGILPGAGGSIAGLVSYAEAKRTSKNSENFGKGEPEGVIATESANNATVGGGFIPTLVLGIPGTPPDAVILGALLIQGVRVGPNLFTTESSIVYTFIFGLFLATILMLPVGLIIGKYAYKTIITLPKAILVPSIAFLTMIGTYAIRNSVSDIIIMIILGICGWILNRAGFSPSPIVLGLILGRIAEQGFVQAWTIGNASGDLLGMFFGRGISLVILFFIIVALFFPLFSNWWSNRRLKQNDKNNNIDIKGVLATVVISIAGLIFLWDTTNMVDADSYIFPRAILLIMLF